MQPPQPLANLHQHRVGEAALMREALRTQEKHREGGVEPALDETSEDPRPGA